ncbi:hypothetical protein Y1Q_0021649 [Alligator mississippiensis]|uniref:Uncharacterized protein n=1 Tax=Alligator mississippiensis TaxID=8496 RepID=A0A151PAL1_ALLMI|nr:hypothetical protein Y1Q_0021649 [Alligator mississippiensis]
MERVIIPICIISCFVKQISLTSINYSQGSFVFLDRSKMRLRFEWTVTWLLCKTRLVCGRSAKGRRSPNDQQLEPLVRATTNN